MSDDQLPPQKKNERDEVKLKSHSLYKKLIENTTDAVFIVDGEGRHIEANKQWANFLGRTQREILHISIWDVVPDDEVKHCQKTMGSLLEGENIPIYTRNFIRSDGVRVTGEMNSILIDDTPDGSKFVLCIVKDITKWREETEKAVRSTETKYRQLLENIPQRIFYKDADSNYIACNPAYAHMLGIEPAEIVGKTDYDFFPKEIADFYRETDREVLESQTQYSKDETNLIDNEERTTHIIKSVVRDNDGAVIGILGIFWDVTERVRAKIALEKSEEQYRLLFDNLTDGLYQMDTKGFITWASKRAADIFGKTPDEVIGSHISEFVHPSEKEKILATIKQALTEGTTQSDGFEVKGIRSDGSIFYYRVNNKILEEDEKIIGIQGLIRDITAFRIAQNALEASEERYRTFAENFQGIAFRGTLDWIPEFFHGSVEAITGYNEKDFTSGNPRWDEVIHPDDKENVFDIGENLSKIPGERINRKYRIIKNNGEIRWVHEFTSNVCDESGVPKWVQGSIYDITDVVLAEKSLKRSLRDLEIYASLLQHDLRNDLQVLLNRSEISLLEKDLTESQKKYWKIIEGTTQSMVRLLDVFIRPSDFYESTITNLIDMVVADNEKIYPDLHIDTIYGAQSSEFTIVGSRLISCVFDNLFRNVVEHAGAQSHVIINIQIKNNQAVIEFFDDGPGIDKTVASRLFQKGSSTTGGGYGLYLSKKIIEGYEGTITVVNKDKKGTTFRIVLPSI